MTQSAEAITADPFPEAEDSASTSSRPATSINSSPNFSGNEATDSSGHRGDQTAPNETSQGQERRSSLAEIEHSGEEAAQRTWENVERSRERLGSYTERMAGWARGMGMPDGEYSFREHALRYPPDAAARSEKVTPEEADQFAAQMQQDFVDRYLMPARLDDASAAIGNVLTPEDFRVVMDRYAATVERRYYSTDPEQMFYGRDFDWAGDQIESYRDLESRESLPVDRDLNIAEVADQSVPGRPTGNESVNPEIEEDAEVARLYWQVAARNHVYGQNLSPEQVRTRQLEAVQSGFQNGSYGKDETGQYVSSVSVYLQEREDEVLRDAELAAIRTLIRQELNLEIKTDEYHEDINWYNVQARVKAGETSESSASGGSPAAREVGQPQSNSEAPRMEQLYAERSAHFWERQAAAGRNVEELRREMTERIEAGLSYGDQVTKTYGGFLEQNDLEEIAAYRQLAQDIGLKVADMTVENTPAGASLFRMKVERVGERQPAGGTSEPELAVARPGRSEQPEPAGQAQNERSSQAKQELNRRIKEYQRYTLTGEKVNLQEYIKKTRQGEIKQHIKRARSRLFGVGPQQDRWVNERAVASVMRMELYRDLANNVLATGRLRPQELDGLQEKVTPRDFREIQRTLHGRIQVMHQKGELRTPEDKRWAMEWNLRYAQHPEEFKGFAAGLRQGVENKMWGWSRDPETGAYRSSSQLMADGLKWAGRKLVERDVGAERRERERLMVNLRSVGRKLTERNIPAEQREREAMMQGFRGVREWVGQLGRESLEELKIAGETPADYQLGGERLAEFTQTQWAKLDLSNRASQLLTASLTRSTYEPMLRRLDQGSDIINRSVPQAEGLRGYQASLPEKELADRFPPTTPSWLRELDDFPPTPSPGLIRASRVANIAAGDEPPLVRPEPSAVASFGDRVPEQGPSSPGLESLEKSPSPTEKVGPHMADSRVLIALISFEPTDPVDIKVSSIYSAVGEVARAVTPSSQQQTDRANGVNLAYNYSLIEGREGVPPLRLIYDLTELAEGGDKEASRILRDALRQIPVGSDLRIVQGEDINHLYQTLKQNSPEYKGLETELESLYSRPVQPVAKDQQVERPPVSSLADDAPVEPVEFAPLGDSAPFAENEYANYEPEEPALSPEEQTILDEIDETASARLALTEILPNSTAADTIDRYLPSIPARNQRAIIYAAHLVYNDRFFQDDPGRRPFLELYELAEQGNSEDPEIADEAIDILRQELNKIPVGAEIGIIGRYETSVVFGILQRHYLSYKRAA